MYTRLQKGFHIERYIDRYILLFSCMCTRVHFSLVIVQHVKNLVSMINVLPVGFFVWICEKENNVRILSPILFIWALQEIKERRIGSVIGRIIFILFSFVTRWAFLLQSVFTVIPLIKERLSGESFKISIFTTTPLKWEKCFRDDRIFFVDDVTVDDVDTQVTPALW